MKSYGAVCGARMTRQSLDVSEHLFGNQTYAVRKGRAKSYVSGCERLQMRQDPPPCPAKTPVLLRCDRMIHNVGEC